MFDANNNRILYIGKKISADVVTGRENLSRGLSRILLSLNEDTIFFEVEDIKCNIWSKYVIGIYGWIDGASLCIVDEVCSLIEENKINLVFIDGSNYGRLVQQIDKRNLDCKIITFFHNCEAKFFLDSARDRKTLKSALVFIANLLAERASCRFSTSVICLTDTDSKNLKKFHGRGADYVVPLFLNSKIDGDDSDSPISDEYCLFVGGDFFANVQAADWLSSCLSKDFPINIVIVGQGMEKYKGKWEMENVHVFGHVASLGPFYRHAKFVVSPIFSGSGMKTKVAEALKYGKLVVGSPQAFIGYEGLPSDLGAIASSREDYLKFCDDVLRGNIVECASQSKSVFLKQYSDFAALECFGAILQDI